MNDLEVTVHRLQRADAQQAYCCMTEAHLYYALSERALIPYKVESKVAVMYCEWVQQRYQKQGYGYFMFDTFVKDMEAWGAKGILVEATDIEGQMHMDHYLARGFTVLLEQGHQKLLYRPIDQTEIRVEALQRQIRPPRLGLKRCSAKFALAQASRSRYWF